MAMEQVTKNIDWMAIGWLWEAVYKEYPVTESERKCANTKREMVGIRQRYANKLYEQSKKLEKTNG